MMGVIVMPVVRTLETEVMRVLSDAGGTELTADDIVRRVRGGTWNAEQVRNAMKRLRSKGVGIAVEQAAGQGARYRMMGANG